MAGLFAYAAAGALAGGGEGLVAQARARREEALEELRNSRLVEREEAGRTFSAEQAQLGRDFTAEQNQAARDASGDLVMMEDGTSAVRQGTNLKPLLGTDGKPAKIAKRSDKDMPAEVDAAEWLIQNGVAKTPTEAWNLVRQARTDPEKSRASIFNRWVDALTKGAFGNVDGDKVQAEAERLTGETLRFLEQADGAAAAPAAGAGAAAPAAGPAETVTTEKSGRAPPAPKDPTKRVLNKVYSAPDGRKVRWKGTGWELAE